MRRKNSYWKWGLTVFLTTCAILVFFDALFLDSTLLGFAKQLMDILAPVVYGAAMAYLLAPMVNWFERNIVSTIKSIRRSDKPFTPNASWLRAAAILLVWALVLFMLYLLMSVLVPQLVDSVNSLILNAENYYNNAYNWITSLLQSYPELAEQVLKLLDLFHTSSQNFLTEELVWKRSRSFRTCSASSG